MARHLPASRICTGLLFVAASLLAACEQSHTPANSAASNPEKFAAVQRGARATDSGASRETSNLPTPGSTMRHGRVRGVNAGHLALQMVLESVISPDGGLQYDRLNSSMNMDMLEQAIEVYSRSEMPEEPAQQLAFYSNAYNANALAILTMFAVYPDTDLLSGADAIERVQMNDQRDVAADTASEQEQQRQRFDEQPVMVASQAMTMGELREQHILGFGDPRVLAFLIDVDPASPCLPRESLWSRQLDEQLDALCAQWVNGGLLVRVEQGQVHLCPMLKRYAGAFEGEVFGGVLGFLQRYANEDGPMGAALNVSSPSNAAGDV